MHTELQLKSNPFKQSLVQEVVYHGTHAYFSKFKETRLIWFSSTKEYAHNFTSVNRQHIIRCYIDLRHPLIINDLDANMNNYTTIDSFLQECIVPIVKQLKCDVKTLFDMMHTSNLYDLIKSEEFVNLLRKTDFDGVSAFESNVNTFAVMSNSQICKLDR